MQKMTKLDDKIKMLVDKNNWVVFLQPWIVYRQPENRKCPNCEILEKLLEINDIGFASINIATPEALTELAFRDSCFPKFTPVLQRGDGVFYKQLWKIHGEELDIDMIKHILDPNKKDWIDLADSDAKKCENGVCEI